MTPAIHGVSRGECHKAESGGLALILPLVSGQITSSLSQCTRGDELEGSFQFCSKS